MVTKHRGTGTQTQRPMGHRHPRNKSIPNKGIKNIHWRDSTGKAEPWNLTLISHLCTKIDSELSSGRTPKSHKNQQRLSYLRIKTTDTEGTT